MTTQAAPFWQKRYTLMVLAFIAMVICYLDRVNISIAAISMKNELGWSDSVKGWVLGSFFIAYMSMMIVGGYLANRFGGKIVLGLAVLFWSLFTLLTPYAAFASLGLLVACRIALGMGEASLAPSAISMFSRWYPAEERSRVVSIFSAGAILGTLIALLTCGILIKNYGWPSVFYVFGALGFIWAIFWFKFISDTPAQHPTISESEKLLLSGDSLVKERPKNIPLKKLLVNKPVWALFITYFATSWGLYVFLSWLPSYFYDAQGLDITQAGIYSAAPWLTMFFMMIFAGWLADSLVKKGKSLTFVRKLMQSIGLFGSASMMLVAKGASTPEFAMFAMCGALGLMAFSYSGCAPNVLDIAPKYADILFGFANTFGTLPGIIGVVIAGILVEKTGSYESVFILTAAIQVIGGLAFLIYGSGKRLFKD